jgi:hypothetical protein
MMESMNCEERERREKGREEKRNMAIEIAIGFDRESFFFSHYVHRKYLENDGVSHIPSLESQLPRELTKCRGTTAHLDLISQRRRRSSAGPDRKRCVVLITYLPALSLLIGTKEGQQGTR